jgi:hypothetical protein
MDWQPTARSHKNILSRGGVDEMRNCKHVKIAPPRGLFTFLKYTINQFKNITHINNI